jgi:hypothetical protein
MPASSSLPIYKYMSANDAVRTIENETLKFNCPINFNDPFDCNMANLKFSKTQSSIDEINHALTTSLMSEDEKTALLLNIEDPLIFANMYREVVQQRIEYSKVTCFSKQYNNTLMWSHYADQHKGACLQFDGSLNHSEILKTRTIDALLEVNYDKTRSINYNVDRSKAIIDLFTRKSADWRYEEELRIIIFNSTDIQEYRKNFLTGVIFGCRMSDHDKKKLMYLIRTKYKFKVKYARKGKNRLEFLTVSH